MANTDSDDAAWMVDLKGGADIILDGIFDDLFKDEIVTTNDNIPKLLTCSSSENRASDTDSVRGEIGPMLNIISACRTQRFCGRLSTTSRDCDHNTHSSY
jgi:hypothetical protein